MVRSRLSPLTMLVVACALALATGAIGGGVGGTVGEWGSPNPPRTPTIAAGPDDPTIATSATFWFSSKGKEDGYECQLDADEPAPCTSPHTYSGLSVGVHSFQVVALGGELRSTAAHYQWTIEPPPPEPPATPTIDSGPPSTTDVKSASFAFSSATPDVTFLCRLDAGAFEACTSPTRYRRLNLGQHTFAVKARNAAEMDSGVASVTWTIVDELAPPPPDSPPPPPEAPAAPTIDSGPPSVTTETSATFAFASATGGVTYLCRLDAAEFAGCASPKSYSNLPLGQHEFSVKARDAAGVESGTASHTWLIETAPVPPPSPQPPPPSPEPPATPTIDSGPPSVTTETSATFTFSSATTGVTFLCRLDSGTFSGCATPKTYGSLALGTHEFSVKARDAAGLESGVASRTWQVESPPPPSVTPPAPEPPATPTIDSGPSSVTNATSASFGFSSRTAGVTFLCRLDAGSFAACSSPKSYSGLVPGRHAFGVKAKDSSGLESGIASASWTVDTTRPTVAISSPDAGSQLSNSVTVAASASDDLRVERVEMRIDGTLTGTSTVAPHTFPWDTTKSANGNHVVEVRSYDVAGNQSTPVSRTYTVSNQSGGGSCAGVQVSPGTDTVAAAVAANQGAVTFCIRPGVHRFSQAVVPPAGSTFVGEPGAILSGARDITALFSQSGSAWVASGMTMEGNGGGQCEGGGTLCLRTNDVYYDDRLLTRVGSIGELSSGKFFFDYGADRIYIADPSSGHKVEVGVAPHALRSWGTGATNVTVRGLVVEKFATPTTSYALEGNAGWVMDDLEVRLNHSCGAIGDFLRNSLVHDNGQCGFSGQDGSVLVENNEFYENHRIPITCEHVASVKILRSTNAVIRSNYSHDEDCGGLWTDWDNIRSLYEGNRVERIGGAGIFHEASCDATIRNNVVRETGFAQNGWIDGSGILVNSSRNVEIFGNTVENNRHGIGGTYTNRGSGSNCGAFELKNLRVHDNVVRVTGRDSAGYWRVAAGTVGILTEPYSALAQFDRNAYTICSQNLFAGPGGYPTWSQWRSLGQDTSSSVTFAQC